MHWLYVETKKKNALRMPSEIDWETRSSLEMG